MRCCHSCGEGLSGVVWRGGRLRAAQSSGQRYYGVSDVSVPSVVSRAVYACLQHRIARCSASLSRRVGGRDGKPTVAFIRLQPQSSKEAKGHPGGEADWRTNMGRAWDGHVGPG